MIGRNDVPKDWKSVGPYSGGQGRRTGFWGCLGRSAKTPWPIQEAGPTWVDRDGHALSSALARYDSTRAANSDIGLVLSRRFVGCYEPFIQETVRHTASIASASGWRVVALPRTTSGVFEVATTYDATLRDHSHIHATRHFFQIWSSPVASSLELYSDNGPIDPALERHVVAALRARLRQCAADSQCVPGSV